MLAAAFTLALGAASVLDPASAYDPKIPAIRAVLGYDHGDEITSPENVATYLKALHEAAPERTRLVEYARSYEGRPLWIFVIGTPERLAALDTVKAGLRRLADPRGLAPAERDRLIGGLPVCVWLMHGVHGNEISSSDAALAEAYHVLAAQGDAAVDAIRKDALLVIDPMENPDGRARFLFQNLQGRASAPDPDPLSAEHDEPWPGGRANHYLFDMNRDWFALSQPETRGRIQVYLDYFPQVAVDLHEMGGNSSYYFAPPADPINPFLPKEQRAWFETFGKNNAARFDAKGFAYFIRENYDSFYPGYGESWPIFQGAIGMTYEQASARALSFRRTDGEILTYKDSVLHHFTAAIETARTAAVNRAELLRYFADYRASAVAEGQRGTREYVLVPGADPSMAERLARLLRSQGIEVRRADEAVKLGPRTVAAGAFLVSTAQPSARLVRNLLDVHVDQDDAFVKEQDRLRKLRKPDGIYDVTAWSLPLVFDVECVPSALPIAVKATPLAVGAEPAASALPAAQVGYLVPWGSGTPGLVVAALRAGMRASVAGDVIRLGGREFGVGTVLFRTADNRGLAASLGPLAAQHGVVPVPTDTAFTDPGGISLGSARMLPLRTPRVLLLWDAPTSSLSAGWARYALERRFGIGATTVRVASLLRAELRRYDVIVMPSGTYVIPPEIVVRLKEWVRTGGTLVTIGDASRWAAREKTGLLETRTEMRDGTPEVDPAAAGDAAKETGKDAKKKDEAPFDYEKSIQPEREAPEATPGAILRVELDRRHWLAAGSDGELGALVESRRIFTPIRLDKGVNAGVYAGKESLRLSGLAWDEALGGLAHKAFLIDQPIGEGHIVAFAEDPNFRAFTEATMLLFANAVVLGPAF